jgi:hypothetical protein
MKKKVTKRGVAKKVGKKIGRKRKAKVAKIPLVQVPVVSALTVQGHKASVESLLALPEQKLKFVVREALTEPTLSARVATALMIEKAQGDQGGA